jgi:hypothetical protein
MQIQNSIKKFSDTHAPGVLSSKLLRIYDRFWVMAAERYSGAAINWVFHCTRKSIQEKATHHRLGGNSYSMQEIFRPLMIRKKAARRIYSPLDGNWNLIRSAGRRGREKDAGVEWFGRRWYVYKFGRSLLVCGNPLKRNKAAGELLPEDSFSGPCAPLGA